MMPSMPFCHQNRSYDQYEEDPVSDEAEQEVAAELTPKSQAISGKPCHNLQRLDVRLAKRSDERLHYLPEEEDTTDSHHLLSQGSGRLQVRRKRSHLCLSPLIQEPCKKPRIMSTHEEATQPALFAPSTPSHDFDLRNNGLLLPFPCTSQSSLSTEQEEDVGFGSSSLSEVSPESSQHRVSHSQAGSQNCLETAGCNQSRIAKHKYWRDQQKQHPLAVSDTALPPQHGSSYSHSRPARTAPTTRMATAATRSTTTTTSSTRTNQWQRREQQIEFLKSPFLIHVVLPGRIQEAGSTSTLGSRVVRRVASSWSQSSNTRTGAAAAATKCRSIAAL